MSPRFAVRALSGVLLSGLVLASACAATPLTEVRQRAQAIRIQHGLRNEELNRAELHRLLHGQARVERMQQRAASDGVVTAAERARILREQDRQGRRIARQSHDAQHRY